MGKELYLMAAKAVKAIYAGECQNQGSTEWASTISEYQGKPAQVLAIGGSDEFIDWVWNGILASWDGVKLCSYWSAKRILKSFVRLDMPLFIGCHSKSGPTGPYLAQKLGADHCVAFCPARGFRKAPVMPNCTLFVDPDDIVPTLGRFSFDHPICDRIVLPKDKKFWDIKGRVGDHPVDHIIEYIKEMA